ncbi:MAG: histidine kinase [Clostridium sp.]|nr:histidine kinase [Clostridium sp.]
MDKKGALRFADSRAAEYVRENRDRDVLEGLHRYMVKTVPGKEMGSDHWLSDMECRNINLGEPGTDSWIQIHSRNVVTERGRHYKYLMYAGMKPESWGMGEWEHSRRLVEASEGYMFEWNIRDDILILGDNWNHKFRAVARSRGRGYKMMESYIWSEDRPRLRKFFNSVLSGDSQDNMLIRFKTAEKENSFAWCSVSLLSVLCDMELPVYVVGIVKDINWKLKQLLERSLEGYEGSAKNRAAEAIDYAKKVLGGSKDEIHALLVIGTENIIPTEDAVGLDILTYQYIETITKMIYPKDRVWIEDGNIILFLNGIGSRENVRNKANRIARILERVSGDNAAIDIGTALFPENGETCEELCRYAGDQLWNNGTRLDREMDELSEKPIEAEGGYHSFMADIVDEWYRMMRVNNLLEKKMKMTEAQLLLSQIKPHFIYNVLANIKSLIYSDPERAETVIVAFTKFLRIQLDAVGRDEMAPFTEILNFISYYLEIEANRFPGKFRVHYEIGFSEFFLPHFSLQPLVENAIKHGICKRAGPGNITIRSYVREDEIVVEVEDDGVGFDMEASLEKGGRKQVGLENVKARISYLSHGRLHIISAPGNGTVASVIIPKTSQEVQLDDY